MLLSVIRRAPYRGLFAGETLTGISTIALTSGLAIKVAADTGNSALVALLVALNAMPVLALSSFVTPALERYGFHRVLVVSQLVAIAAMITALVMFATRTLDVVGAFAVVTVVGASLSFHTPAVYGSLAWFVGEQNVPFAVSSINLRTGVSWVIGPVLGAALVTQADGAVLVAVCVALATAGLVPYLLRRRDFAEAEQRMAAMREHDPQIVRRMVEGGVEAADMNGVCMLTQAPVRSGVGYLALLKVPVIAFIMVLYLVMYACLGVFSILLSTWGSVNLGIGMMALGSLYSVRSAASMPGPLITDMVLRRLGMGPTLIASSLVVTGSVLLAVSQEQLGLLAWVGLILYGAVFFTLTSGVMTSLVTVAIGPHKRAEGAALYAAVKGVVSLLFVGIGIVATMASPAPVLAATAIAGMAGVLALRLLSRRRWNEMTQAYDAGLSTPTAG